MLQFCKQEVWLQKKVSLCGKRALTSLFTPQTRSLSNLPSVCHQKFKLSASLSVHMISGTEKYIKKCLLRGLLIKRITKKKTWFKHPWTEYFKVYRNWKNTCNILVVHRTIHLYSQITLLNVKIWMNRVHSLYKHRDKSYMAKRNRSAGNKTADLAKVIT